MNKLFVLGFPSEYGGANTELWHQIILWSKAFENELEVHIIPTGPNPQNEKLFEQVTDLGVIVHERPREYGYIGPDDAIINFCSGEFLEDLPKIHQKTKRIMWVNCMTWLFPKEMKIAREGIIRHFLYQRDEVRADHEFKLKEQHDCPDDCNFQTFLPYFYEEGYEFTLEEHEKTNIGRISRQDPDKFDKKTLHIYEYITSPKFKAGHFLGFGDKIIKKIGVPFSWIKTYHDQTELPIRDFYRLVDFIVQPTNTMENLPRIGFEAMHTGTPLIVDNRGGWKHLIEHGKSGFLCDDYKEFIYWGTRLAFEDNLRHDVAHAAKERVRKLSSFESSKESWQKVFERVF